MHIFSVLQTQKLSPLLCSLHPLLPAQPAFVQGLLPAVGFLLCIPPDLCGGRTHPIPSNYTIMGLVVSVMGFGVLLVCPLNTTCPFIISGSHFPVHATFRPHIPLFHQGPTCLASQPLTHTAGNTGTALITACCGNLSLQMSCCDHRWLHGHRQAAPWGYTFFTAVPYGFELRLPELFLWATGLHHGKIHCQARAQGDHNGSSPTTGMHIKAAGQGWAQKPAIWKGSFTCSSLAASRGYPWFSHPALSPSEDWAVPGTSWGTWIDLQLETSSNPGWEHKTSRAEMNQQLKHLWRNVSSVWYHIGVYSPPQPLEDTSAS